jgi:hypothetical protein
MMLEHFKAQTEFDVDWEYIYEVVAGDGEKKVFRSTPDPGLAEREKERLTEAALHIGLKPEFKMRRRKRVSHLYIGDWEDFE